jgi:hypothetical protein
MKYNHEKMSELLNLVHTRFPWGLSCEGNEYWESFYNELLKVVDAADEERPRIDVHVKLRKPSADDYSRLVELLDHVKLRKPSADDYSRLVELLDDAFSWRDSPQGAGFWNRYNVDFQTMAEQLREKEGRAEPCPDCNEQHSAPPCPEAEAERKMVDPVVDPDGFYLLTNILRNGFNWDEGIDGNNYWSNLYDTLRDIALEHDYAVAKFEPRKVKDPTAEQHKEMAALLAMALDWTKTEQGVSFWEEKYSDLMRWAKGLETAPVEKVEESKVEAAQRPQRGTILDQAKAIINGERQDQYGNPEDSFGLIAELWSGYLGRDIFTHQVPVMLSLMKIARQKHQHKKDNLIDACGYLALAADMVKEGDGGDDKR